MLRFQPNILKFGFLSLVTELLAVLYFDITVCLTLSVERVARYYVFVLGNSYFFT